MMSPLKAAAVYFAIVFAAGFVLGAVRLAMLVPVLGSVGAVLVELPIILAISWFACAWVIRHFRVPARVRPRAIMGATAFLLLMIAELTLSVVVFDHSAAEFAISLASLPGALGLAGQLAFATFPLLQSRMR